MTESKLLRTFTSRQVWASVLAFFITFTLFRTGEITGAQYAEAVSWITAVFFGSVAIEDGLSHIFTVWSEEPIGTEPED